MTLHKEQIPNNESMAGSLDFKKMFFDKLATIEPYDERTGKLTAKHFLLNDIGIAQVKRLVPSLVFSIQSDLPTSLDMYLEDPGNIAGEDYPHWAMENKLTDMLRKNGYALKHDRLLLKTSCFIVQDVGDRLFLLLDPIPTGEIKNRIESNLTKQVWFMLVEKYNLDKIVGSTGPAWMGIDGDKEIILEKDIIGKIREDDYMQSFADKYGMTNFQFTRFRIRILSAIDAGIPVDYDTIARESIEHQSFK